MLTSLSLCVCVCRLNMSTATRTPVKPLQSNAVKVVSRIAALPVPPAKGSVPSKDEEEAARKKAVDVAPSVPKATLLIEEEQKTAPGSKKRKQPEADTPDTGDSSEYSIARAITQTSDDVAKDAVICEAISRAIEHAMKKQKLFHVLEVGIANCTADASVDHVATDQLAAMRYAVGNTFETVLESSEESQDWKAFRASMGLDEEERDEGEGEQHDTDAKEEGEKWRLASARYKTAIEGYSVKELEKIHNALMWVVKERLRMSEGDGNYEYTVYGVDSCPIGGRGEDVDTVLSTSIDSVNAPDDNDD